ncbi:MAG: hypothetical protein [Bacteriophage sp.]|jgi:hypothetical protein|uniref:Uncharacterized protein n=1 Tax=Myoviridae sp. ctNQV2 TaxID=2827683 RepID=A0A8S5RZP7_9CAUD|nr:MAG: hypothetical protein [Bacteriophage sp.]DAF43999.1 MAG TPA: hypothetical protein [Myoviridae sp. ctNQV2]UVX32859.1 MAG: hypothetical protein [Bacteriophage sp.]UWF82397.1 MAG: hypothetical protein [Bacteriophage sp.]UWG14947.1 MAG: hypothetical protein [Bacteriophage sp.]
MKQENLYNSYEEIEKDVDNGMVVSVKNTQFFIKKINNDYYVVAEQHNGKLVIYHPMRQYLLSTFENKTSDDKIIAQQAKFLSNDIIGKISDKEELEEYLKIRLKEFLKIINKQ